jgi:hypothetical protein
MANETTPASLGKLIPSEVLQEARLAFQKNAEVLPLVNVVDLSGQPGVTADFPIHTTVAITTPASVTTDVTTSSIIQPTFATLTLRRQTARVDVSDLAQESVSGVAPSVTAGRLIGNARIKAVETHVLGNMTSTWTSSVGATNSTAITPENILSALLTLKKNEANENLVLSLHPSQEYHLLDDVVVTSSSGSDRSELGQSSMADGGLGGKMLFGAKVVSSMRVSTATDSNDIYLGMLFNGMELGYAVKNIGANGGIEFQRDASIALNEIVQNYYDSSGRIRAGAFVLVKSQTY